jgi:hypothetical protein
VSCVLIYQLCRVKASAEKNNLTLCPESLEPMTVLFVIYTTRSICSSALKIEEVLCSETSVTFYTARRLIPEDRALHTHRH